MTGRGAERCHPIECLGGCHLTARFALVEQRGHLVGVESLRRLLRLVLLQLRRNLIGLEFGLLLFRLHGLLGLFLFRLFLFRLFLFRLLFFRFLFFGLFLLGLFLLQVLGGVIRFGLRLLGPFGLLGRFRFGLRVGLRLRRRSRVGGDLGLVRDVGGELLHRLRLTDLVGQRLLLVERLRRVFHAGGELRELSRGNEVHPQRFGRRRLVRLCRERHKHPQQHDQVRNARYGQARLHPPPCSTSVTSATR